MNLVRFKDGSTALLADHAAIGDVIHTGTRAECLRHQERECVLMNGLWLLRHVEKAKPAKRRSLKEIRAIRAAWQEKLLGKFLVALDPISQVIPPGDHLCVNLAFHNSRSTSPLLYLVGVDGLYPYLNSATGESNFLVQRL